jgi:hypothetical protein
MKNKCSAPFMIVQLPPPTHSGLSLIQIVRYDSVRGLHDVRGEEEDSDEQPRGLDR